MRGSFMTTLCVLVLCVPVVAAGSNWPVGTWVDPNDDGTAIHLDAWSFRSASDGRLQWVARVESWDGVTLSVCSWGSLSEIYLSAVDGGLALTWGPDQPVQRLVTWSGPRPGVFALEPMELPGAEPIDADRRAAIRAVLEQRFAEDQRVRTGEVSIDEEVAVDRENTDWLVGVVQELGWIDAERFGADATSRAFMLVQHSGHLPLMGAALPHARRDDPQSAALLEDRLRVATGRPQIYGTQIGGDELGPGVIELEDPERVDERRATVGLGPLKTYVGRFGMDEVRIISCP